MQKKILGNSLGKLIEKLFEYKFEKTIKIFLFIKTTLSAQNGNQKQNLFLFNELKFKFNGNIQDKIKNNILPIDKINNKIEKVPVSSDFEDQLMMDDELQKLKIITLQ